MRKNWTLRIAIVAFAVTILSLCMVSNTFAKYTKTVSATDSAQIAKFSFNAKDKDGTLFGNLVNVDMFDDITYAATDSVAAGLLAPGCFGNFTVAVDCTGSQVSTAVSISTFDIDDGSTEDSEGIPLAFCVKSTAGVPDNDTAYNITKENLASAVKGLIEGTIAHSDIGKTKTAYIYWKWIDSDNAGDTLLGSFTDVAPTYTISISVVGSQVVS